MIVLVHGPNLPDQSKGTFQVHTYACKDNKKYVWAEHEMMAVESRLEVAAIIYPPGDFDWDGSLEESDWYLMDIWFAPCTKALPVEKS